MTDLYEAMRTLRAVRRLKPDPVPDAVLRRVLEAASFAPTGGNAQPWRVVVVRDAEKKRRLGVWYAESWRAYVSHHRRLLADAPEEVAAKAERMIAAGDGGAAIWPLVLGPARAKQYLLTGDPVGAAEAERLGLVNRVVPAAALEEEALGFARRLAAGAPLALRYTKQAVNKLVKDALNLAFDTSTALEIVTFQSEDHKEALAALREKRAPRFRGR